jgi:hypothetical protein
VETIRTLSQHRAGWRRWLKASDRESCRTKDIRARAVMRVQRALIVAVAEGAAANGLVSRNDHKAVLRTIETWEEASCAERLAVLSLHVEICDAVLGAVPGHFAAFWRQCAGRLLAEPEALIAMVLGEQSAGDHTPAAGVA